MKNEIYFSSNKENVIFNSTNKIFSMNICKYVNKADTLSELK